MAASNRKVNKEYTICRFSSIEKASRNEIGSDSLFTIGKIAVQHLPNPAKHTPSPGSQAPQKEKGKRNVGYWDTECVYVTLREVKLWQPHAVEVKGSTEGIVLLWATVNFSGLDSWVGCSLRRNSSARNQDINNVQGRVQTATKNASPRGNWLPTR